MMLADDWILEHLLHVAPVPILGKYLSWIGISGHVLAMFIVAGLMLWIFPTVAADKNLVPKSVFRNLFETILCFIRDEVARPNLGHNTDKYIPVIWTFFFYILFCNLLGLVPGMATATGQVWVTGTLAVMAFIFYHLSGVWEQGLIPYIKNIVPPGIPKLLILPMFLVEIVGHLAKPFALTVRLWANMTGGHAVLYVFLGFVFVFKSFAVGPVSVAAASAVYMLELMVAFLQAYVFTLLVCVFLGGAVHPEH